MKIEHNSHISLYRCPFGAVNSGTSVTVRLLLTDFSIPSHIRLMYEFSGTETGIDMVDIFIAYMDHVAYTSKKMAAEAEVNITAEDVDNNNIKLYPTQK